MRRAERAFEDLEDVYLESYRAAVDYAFRMRESNARITQNFFTGYIELMEDHATLNKQASRKMIGDPDERREVFLKLAEKGFVGSLPAGSDDSSRGS